MSTKKLDSNESALDSIAVIATATLAFENALNALSIESRLVHIKQFFIDMMSCHEQTEEMEIYCTLHAVLNKKGKFND